MTILNTAGAPVNIGRLSGWDGFYFNGSIDEMAIFPWELSPDNVAAIASSGLQVAQSVSPSGKLTTVWGLLKSE